MYTLRSNRNTVHIEGIPAGTKVIGDGEDNGSGVVSYYAQSACSALTRGATRMNIGESFEALADAITAAAIYACARGLKLCTRCATAAERHLAADPLPEPELVPVTHDDELAARVHEGAAVAAAANTHLSPTAQAKAAAGAARDEAMRIAYEAEGTDGEAAADAAFRSADALYQNATRNHRAACEAWASPRDTETETARIRRHNRATVHAAIVTTGTDAERDEGDELVTLCGTAGPRGNKLRGWLVLAQDTPVTCERCGADPIAETVTEPPAADPQRPSLALAVGAAYTIDNIETEPAERRRMTKFQVVINQVVTTTVYVEAPNRETAVDIAVTEIPELCGQCAGMGPRESDQVSEVNTYVNDHYDEPVVAELDENGCIPTNPWETAESVKRDGSAAEKTHTTVDLTEVVAELDQFHEGTAPILFDIDPQGNPTTFGPSALVNPDPANLEPLPVHIMAGDHLEPATRERLAAAEELTALDHMTEIAQRGAERERAHDLAQREYLYLAERYARTGDHEDGERLDNALETYHAAAATAGRCSAIGVDWSCGAAAETGEATCAAHLGTVARKAPHRG